MRNLWRLMGFVRKYWVQLLLALFGMIAGTAFSLAIPRVLGRSIDSVLTSGQRNNLLLAGGIILGASALRGMMAYVNRFLTQVVSQRVSYDIRNKLYNHLQRLSFAYYDKAQTGQLMSRATVDIEAMRMFFGEGLLGVLQMVLLVGGVTYLLMTLNWKLALITLA
ncbi:MAG: hypothetical protein HY663_05700, partial [Chloroflexi bacterium]|nr:hypothetical protein [Chloroflexota bacterium]